MTESGIGVPVVIAGLGDIGRAVARAVLSRPELRLVGAVDPSQDLAGKPLEALLGVPCPELMVEATSARAFAAARGGVLLQATGSTFTSVLDQIEDAVQSGLSVVSTCEELAYPWLRYEDRAERLDALCEEHDVAVIGTGVNPGFVLDRLPAFLSQVVGTVRHIKVVRVVDASTRRASLQRKIGAGLSEEAFHDAVDQGSIGHVGLAESATLAALGCGLELDEVDEEIEPLVAEEDFDGALVPVKHGQVAGLQHVVRGFSEGKELVRLDLTIAIGAEDPRDEVELDADPPLRLVIPGGVAGDDATAWAVVNAVLPVTLLHGLVTVLDLPSGR